MTEGRLFSAPWRSITTTILLTLILDQVTKFLAQAFLQPVYSTPLIGDFLRLTYVENPGMAFGIGIGNRLIYNSLSILAVSIILFYLYKLRKEKILSLSFALIVGGAFGNLLDRFMYGRVIDFVDIEFFDINLTGGSFFFLDLPVYTLTRWPVFNFADMAITVGMITIIFSAFLETRPAENIENGAREKI